MPETKIDRIKGKDRKIHNYSERFLIPSSKQSIGQLKEKDITDIDFNKQCHQSSLPNCQKTLQPTGGECTFFQIHMEY